MSVKLLGKSAKPKPTRPSKKGLISGGGGGWLSSVKSRVALGVTLVAVVALGYVIVNTYATTGPDPKWSSCVGYPEPRTFVQAQSWWIPDDGSRPGTGNAQARGGFNHGHATIGACIPSRERQITQSFVLDIKVESHMNPSVLQKVMVFYKSGGSNGSVQNINPPGGTMQPTGRLSCPHDAQIPRCEQWYNMTVRPSDFPNAGLQEVRVRAFNTTPAEPTAIDDSATFNFQINVRNGRNVNEVTRAPLLRGKSVYSEGLAPAYPNPNRPYCEAAYDDRVTPLPTTPLRGTWTPKVSMTDFPSGNFNMPPTYHRAVIDPEYHTDPVIPGRQVLNGTGAFDGRLSIDTRQLAAGVPHKLFLLTECRDDRVQDRRGRSLVRKSTASGVLVITFYVADQGQGGETGGLRAPTNLRASAATAWRMNLAWTASAGAQRYDIYRGNDLVGSSTTTSFQDRALQPGTAYNYSVAAVSGLTSRLSTMVTATTLSTAATPTPRAATSQSAAFEPLELRFNAPQASARLSGIRVIDVGLSGTNAAMVDRVVFDIDGQVVGSRSDPESEMVYQLDLYTTNFTNGAHTLRVKGVDANNNVKVTNTLPVIISN